MTARKASKKQASQSYPPLTKARFLALLRRAAQPIKKDAGEPAPSSHQTAESHRPDGCTETHMHQGKTEGVVGPGE